MTVLAAITPPFLVCAVVIAAIVAFLRHEMGRSHEDRRGDRADNAGLQAADDRPDAGAESDADAATSTRRDG